MVVQSVNYRTVVLKLWLQVNLEIVWFQYCISDMKPSTHQSIPHLFFSRSRVTRTLNAL